jgi:hypothetical protein
MGTDSLPIEKAGFLNFKRLSKNFPDRPHPKKKKNWHKNFFMFLDFPPCAKSIAG